MELLRWMVRLFCAGAAAPPAAPGYAQCAGLEPSSHPVMAPGVEYKLLMNSLGGPRQVLVDDAGNLLVVEGGSGGVRRIVLDDGEGLDVCVASSSELIPGSGFNHGLALSIDGKTLFASTPLEILAYSYDADSGEIGEPKTIVTEMDMGGGHRTRTLYIPPQNPDILMVSWGSKGNVDANTIDVSWGRSQVRNFDIPALMAADAPVPYVSGAVLGWGLRNSVGIAQDPRTGFVWTVENSVDNLQRFGKDVHNTNPGEEMNFHGRPNDTESAFYGKNYGYPGCYAIWDSASVEDYPGGAATGEQMMGIERDGDDMGFDDEYCKHKVIPPRITFGSHLAPLDIHFRADGSAALISMHGSWNRQPPNGYRVSRVDFRDGMPVELSTSRKAEVPLMWNADNAECPGGCFRPVGLAFDKTERLFMTSDSTGELYVLTGV